MNITMSDIIQTAEERRAELVRLLKYLKMNTEEFPDGQLIVSRSDVRTQYYLCQTKKDASGRFVKKRSYIPRKNRELAAQIAQRDYYERVTETAEKELIWISRILKKAPSVAAEDIYARLSSGRRELVTPIELDDDAYIKQWENQQYERKEFSEDYPEYYTAKNERVRSKSEILIADTLGRMGVPYRYEYPVILGGRRIYPDFTLLHSRKRKEIFWEHLGMMDNMEYVENALSRIDLYESEGYMMGSDLILTWETARLPLNTRKIRRMIEQLLL